MATAGVRILFLVHVISLFCVSVHSFRPGSRAKTLHFPHQEENDGIKRIRRSIPTENEGPAARSRTARQAENTPDQSPHSAGEGIEVNKFDLNDPHPELIVHWAGKGSDVILCLTRDITQTVNSASYVYISDDYGASFVNKSSTMFGTTQGNRPVYDRFYSSKADIERYMFTDVVNSLVTTTQDFGITFSTFSAPFKPTSIFTHAVNSDIVLGMDENDASKRLYISMNFGGTWGLVDRDVKSFNWGVEPWDRTDTIYVERLEGDGTSSVSKSDDFFHENRQEVVTGIKDFEVRDDYLFATQEKSGTTDQLELLVSHDRGSFQVAEFPFTDPNLDFYIADASEEQVFVCVHHRNVQTNLYISEAKGAVFSLSLMNISYYNPEGAGKDSWLRRYADEPFADFHKVDGLRGIYAATVLRNADGSESYAAENMATVGTFDKGGEWFPVPAPENKADGTPYDCSIYEGCSLHLSQKFSQLSPGSRTIPILSKASAPGLILATGKVGKTLLGNETMGFNVYLSATAGASWYEVLLGNHFFAFGDHGGVVTAVEQRGDTNAVKYSVNEGETWHTESFSDSKIYVYGLMTEPGEQTLTFTVFGSETATHSWLIVQINFRQVFSTTCGDDDYKQWWPGEEFPEHSCLLGRKTIYERRRVHSDCYNGRDYDRPISSINCTCDRDDFECDFGFMESINSYTCIKDPEDERDPTVQPNICREGQFWRRSKGYRKVEGDTCHGGEEKYYEADQVSCPVAESAEFILYAERTEIHRYFLNDGTQERLPIEGLQLATAVDYDIDHDCYYYAEVTYDEIHRFCPGDSEDQNQVIVSAGLDMVEGIAFDWLAENLYWVDSNSDQIEVARFDGRFRRVLVMNVTIDQPRGLALDPKRGNMYWTDWGDNPYIATAHMDGKNVTKLITTGIYWPNGLAIDDSTSHIFWTDAHFDRIETAWLDGSHREVLLDENTPHPFAIAVYKNMIYWDDWSQLSIQSANKYTGLSVRTVVDGLDSAMDLKIFHNASQQGVNPCSQHNGGCTHLCIVKPDASNPDGVTRVCLCPDNMKIVITPDGREDCQCEPGEKLNVTSGYCVTQGSTCEPDQFQCSGSDRCIPLHWHCDHESDCDDGSDELNCPYFTCSPDEFHCNSGGGQCIPLSWQCDHYDDCGDNSDEIGCVFPSCSHDQFTCKNGRCIPMGYVCDLDNDCWDNSDEEDCEITNIPTTMASSCDPNYTQCEPNGRCIPLGWVCDGEDDCGNNWDEQNCNATTCTSFDFSCDNGHCIPSYWQCDNYDDCGDNSDERDCPSTTYAPWTTSDPFGCNDGDFHCFSDDLCIPYNWKCDGYRDCEDGSDEYDCISNSSSTTPYPFSCDWDSFVCDNGQCIPGDWECDFYRDCSDNSDENHCSSTTMMPYTPPIDECQFLRVPCGPGAIPRCIWQWLLCDGDDDCSDGSDEAHCGTARPTPTTIPIPTTVSHCSTGQFKCRNGQKCIPRSEQCNGYYDCSDTSDEDGCQTATTAEAPTLCSGHGQFGCSFARECVDNLQHCDGFLDCTSGEDEFNCNSTYVVQKMAVGVGSDIKSALMYYTLPPDIPSVFTVSLLKREADPLAAQPGHNLPNPAFFNYTCDAGTSGRFSYTWTNLKAETDYVFTATIVIASKEFNKFPMVSYKTPADSRVIPAPINVQALAKLEDSQWMVNVTWSYNTPNALFHIFYRADHSSRLISAGYEKKKYIELYQLKEDMLYFISVSAEVDDVMGNSSAEVSVFVGKGSIRNASTNLIVSNVKKDSADLRWTKPAVEPEVNITGYHVYASLDGQVEPKNIGNSTTTHITLLHKLCPGTRYVFTVAAYNDLGEGPPSQSANCLTTGTAYTAPQNLTATVLSKHSIKLQWLAPGSAPGGLVLNSDLPIFMTEVSGFDECVGEHAKLVCYASVYESVCYVCALYALTCDQCFYVQTYDIAISQGSLDYFSVQTSSLFYTFTGLQADVTYQFAVRLHVSCENAPIAVTRALTQYDATLPPRNLLVKNINFQDVTLTWKSPRDNMPTAIGYLITYWNVSTPANRTNITVPASTNKDFTKIVSNLVPGGNYHFAVQANAPSAQNKMISAITKLPSEPTAFQAVVENGVIHMYWGPPDDTWNNKLGFAVYHVKMGDVFPGQTDVTLIPDDALRMVEHNISLWTITGGLPGYHYEFPKEIDPEMYAVMVSVDQYMGYYGKTTQLLTVSKSKGAEPHKQVTKNQALYAGIAVGIVVIVLLVIVVYFAVRHRRLQQSFMSFANSHYDTRSGTATFATSEDDDGGDLELLAELQGSDEDQPMIRGFSDDVPLVIA